MPHGTLRIGLVEVVSLCDGITFGGGPQESFPGVREEIWATSRERYPWAFGEDDGWRLHVHASVLRSEGHTILVDTGVGPESAPAFAWSEIRGALPKELAAAGVDIAEIETELEQAYDLLRARRARRAAGLDPDVEPVIDLASVED